MTDAEGETLCLADTGETLRLQYHQGTRLWREPAFMRGTDGESLFQMKEGNLSGIRDRV